VAIKAYRRASSDASGSDCSMQTSSHSEEATALIEIREALFASTSLSKTNSSSMRADRELLDTNSDSIGLSFLLTKYGLG
jgi:hypothetical protein